MESPRTPPTTSHHGFTNLWDGGRRGVGLQGPARGRLRQNTPGFRNSCSQLLRTNCQIWRSGTKVSFIFAKATCSLNKAKRSAKQQRSDVRICFCLLASRRSDANWLPPEKSSYSGELLTARTAVKRKSTCTKQQKAKLK